MGYYSDVTIMCEVKAFEMFKKAWESVDFKPAKVLTVPRTELPDDYIIEWNYVKWYWGYKDVKAIEDVCSTLSEDTYDSEIGYAYKMIRIGEDNATEEEANLRGWEELDLYVEVHCDYPEAIEIEI